MGHAPKCAGNVSVCMPIPIEFRSDRRICVTICAPEVRAPPLSRDAQARQRRDPIANAHGGDGTAELSSLKVALGSRATRARLSQCRRCGFWIYRAHSPRPMKCKWWRTRVSARAPLASRVEFAALYGPETKSDGNRRCSCTRFRCRS